MNTRLQTQMKVIPNPSFARAHTELLQCKCASNECEKRLKKRLTLQRSSTREEPSEVPPIVHEVLSSPGQPLDMATRAFMEPRFGHDFSKVRVHADAKASESARAVNALAYTVGQDVVFSVGQDVPQTRAGQKLLAHELTHVVQQGMSGSPPTLDLVEAEAEADRNSGVAETPEVAECTHAVSTQIQFQRRAPIPKPLDAEAEKIVSVVMPNPKDKRDIGMKAVELVYRILNKYFPGYASKVAGVGYDPSTKDPSKKGEQGLEVVPRPSTGGGPIYGLIYVYKLFVDTLIKDKFTFADHVAMVAHELEHIDQWRSPGFGPGREKSDEREFLAHAHEALFVVPPGTGEMRHSTRVYHIDTALGYYFCIPENARKPHQGLVDEIRARRKSEIRYVQDPLPEPTACKRPEYEKR